MKAIRYTHYGSPERLHLVDVDRPEIPEGHVLVKVHAASANPLDWHYMRGKPVFMRLGSGMLRPNDPRLGADLSGTVESIGSAVTRFKPGDAVFGAGKGTFAEYATIREEDLALKPAAIPFEGAAGVTVAALTALQGLRDAGKIVAGQKVLVNGAAGGVGTFAVQIARAFGAEVTAVCSTTKLDMVRGIGAHHAIDYTQEDFTRIGLRYDLIFDLIANHAARDLVNILRPGGRCVIGGFSGVPRLIEYMLIGPRLTRGTDRWFGMMPIARLTSADLEVLRELLEAASITTVIDRCYPLAQTPEAIRYLEHGHAAGKVIITIP